MPSRQILSLFISMGCYHIRPNCITQTMIKQTETFAIGESLPWPEVLGSLPFNQQGLIPAIAQQHDSGEVLMMAWMNREAVSETLRTGQVCYFSRSRQKLWRKGESS